MSKLNYAFIKNNNVVNMAIFDNPTNELLDHFKNEFDLDLIIEGTENSVIGGTYDGYKFWFPQPYPSWTKNEDLNQWEAPIPYPAFDPENPRYYEWNEDILNWEEIQVSE
jgi:hypothetical protein